MTGATTDHAIELIGPGELAGALAAQLRATAGASITWHKTLSHPSDSASNSEHYHHHEAVSSPGLVVSATDSWDPVAHHVAWRRSRAVSAAWLGVHVEFGAAIIGPLVQAERPGCPMCRDDRRIAAREEADAFARVRRQLEARAGSEATEQMNLATGLTSFTIEAVVNLTAREILCWMAGRSTARAPHAWIAIDLTTMAITRHRFLPDPRCPVCGDMPEDTAQRATLTLSTQRKLSPSTFRVRPLLQEKPALLETYVDGASGMITGFTKDNSRLFANMVARLPIQEGRRREVGIGRAFDFDHSLVQAIAEALERYGGLRPGGKRTVVRASYHDVQASALNPRALGLYTKDQMSHPAFGYAEYTDDLVFNWVWAYSFQQQRPLLVPEQCAYYGLGYWRTERPFMYEISNGCAIGGCLEEAILHGMIEVAERDAFLLTWYARLGVPRIDLDSASDPTIALAYERIHRLTGYTIYAYDTTMEHGIPSTWVLAVDELDRLHEPKAVCAAGADLDLEGAVLNALQEIGPIIGMQRQRFRESHIREQAEQMLENPYAVTHMDHHAQLYCHPDAFQRLDFLYNTQRTETFAEAASHSRALEPGLDLKADLEVLLERSQQCGVDVIVVDQTTPEHELKSFRCVKVLMPGMLPMTFGYHARRIHGFDRLHRLPQQLGYRATALPESEINPHPHPFP